MVQVFLQDLTLFSVCATCISILLLPGSLVGWVRGTFEAAVTVPGIAVPAWTEKLHLRVSWNRSKSFLKNICINFVVAL